jgi:AcrR family transcriptional regulator
MSQSELLSPEKEAQILQGATVVFARDGYEGASMSRIAAEAGVSKGTLYNYFESKAELFAAYVQQECSRKLAIIFQEPDPTAPPSATLRGIGMRMIEMMLSNTGLTVYRVVISEAEKFPALARKFYDAGPAMGQRYLADWLVAETRRGRLAVPDPEFAAEQFFSLCQTRLWMRRKLQLQGEPSAAEIGRVVDASVEMFLNTYAA